MHLAQTAEVSQFEGPGVSFDTALTDILIDGSAAAFDYVLAHPGASIHGAHGETVSVAVIGGIRWAARWPLACTIESHRHVGSSRDIVLRETYNQREWKDVGLLAGECRRCLRGTLSIPIMERD